MLNTEIYKRVALKYAIIALVLMLLAPYLSGFIGKYLTFLVGIPYILTFISYFLILIILNFALDKIMGI